MDSQHEHDRFAEGGKEVPCLLETETYALWLLPELTSGEYTGLAIEQRTGGAAPLITDEKTGAVTEGELIPMEVAFDQEDAVEIAVAILTRFAPDRLAAVKRAA